VAHRITPAELSHGRFTTVQGGTLSTAGSAGSFTVGPGRAHIVCGGIQTANATVYIIDQVLLPTGWASLAVEQGAQERSGLPARSARRSAA